MHTEQLSFTLQHVRKHFNLPTVLLCILDLLLYAFLSVHCIIGLRFTTNCHAYFFKSGYNIIWSHHFVCYLGNIISKSGCSEKYCGAQALQLPHGSSLCLIHSFSGWINCWFRKYLKLFCNFGEGSVCAKLHQPKPNKLCLLYCSWNVENKKPDVQTLFCVRRLSS